jgi:hypothetical protein
MMIPESEVMLFDPLSSWTGDQLANGCVKAVFKWAIIRVAQGREVLWGAHAHYIYARATDLIAERGGAPESESTGHLLLVPSDDRLVSKVIFERPENGRCDMEGIEYSVYQF